MNFASANEGVNPFIILRVMRLGIFRIMPRINPRNNWAYHSGLDCIFADSWLPLIMFSVSFDLKLMLKGGLKVNLYRRPKFNRHRKSTIFNYS